MMFLGKEFSNGSIILLIAQESQQLEVLQLIPQKFVRPLVKLHLRLLEILQVMVLQFNGRVLQLQLEHILISVQARIQ
mgnify:CR=1 FL=1